MESGPSEEEIAQKWRDLAAVAAVLSRRSDTRGDFATAPGSAIAGDDTHLGGYQLTSAFRFCLTAAIDHLHAVTSLVQEHRLLHIAAPASLARGLLENAAAGFWLIHPAQRDERITRTLRWWAKNARDQDRAMRDRPAAGKSSAEVVLARLRALAEARGIDPATAVKGYTSTEAVTYAEQQVGHDQLGPLFPWQICSGFAHGRPWAMLGASQVEPQGESLSWSGLNDVRLSNSLGLALYPTLAGVELLQTTLRVHRDRTTA